MTSVATADVSELAAAQERGDLIVDVREQHEYVSGHVPGAVLMPMHTVPLRLSELPADQPFYVVCESGARSWQATAFLVRNGKQAVNVQGGMGAWRMSGRPMETGAPASTPDGGHR